jgi:tetraacyldisaccharide 4'-kinase
LQRDIEIAIVDGVRRFGNQSLLPAGPLREPVSRLKQVDFVVSQQKAMRDECLMVLFGDEVVSLRDPSIKKPLADLAHSKVHVLAAIGHPARFFSDMRQSGLDIIPHEFPDHYHFREEDILFGDGLPVLMTEKDAVKCARMAEDCHWYLPVSVELDLAFTQKLLDRLKQVGRIEQSEIRQI